MNKDLRPESAGKKGVEGLEKLIMKVTRTVKTESYKINGQEFHSFDELPEDIKRELDKDGNGQADFLEGKDDRFKLKTVQKKIHPTKYSMHFERGNKKPAPSEAEKSFNRDLIRGLFVILGIGIVLSAIRFALI